MARSPGKAARLHLPHLRNFCIYLFTENKENDESSKCHPLIPVKYLIIILFAVLVIALAIATGLIGECYPLFSGVSIKLSRIKCFTILLKGRIETVSVPFFIKQSRLTFLTFVV